MVTDLEEDDKPGGNLPSRGHGQENRSPRFTNWTIIPVKIVEIVYTLPSVKTPHSGIFKVVFVTNRVADRGNPRNN